MNTTLPSFYGQPKLILFGVEVCAGANITKVIADGISLARDLTSAIQFDFNGVVVQVKSDSDPDLIYRDWNRSLCGYTGKAVVGPYPPPTLSDMEKTSDAESEKENERKRQERHRKYEMEVSAKRSRVADKLINVEMEFANEDAWQLMKDKNQDSYGGGVIVYAERWAQLMQVEMATGKTLENVADATSQEADIEGITGFMYGCAVSTLAKCWKHGEQLRKWHNLKTQIGNEGEKANESGSVLNPALLSIGK